MTVKPAPRTPTPARRLLARILDEPRLVGAVRSLEPRALLRLIHRIGLEDAGEIIALATVDQLVRVFDDDLWRSERPGEDERFDPARFVVWLEVMLEAGDAFAADKLAEVSEDLVTLALHHHVLVVNLDELALQMSERPDDDGDDEQLDKALEGAPYHEFGEYRVIARRHDGWDAIVAVLAALDERHADALQRILARLCWASSEYIDDNGGLYAVLTSEDMLDADAAAEREDRRAEAGFVAPSSAAAFLELARTGDVDAVLAEPDRDPTTRAYFRGYRAEAAAAERRAAEASERAAKLLDLPGDAEAAPTRRTALLDGARSDPATLLARALGELSARDAGRHDERMHELGYLANVLLAGAGRDGRRLRPVEASETALATCNLGLERVLGAAPAAAVDRLARTGCDKLFRIGVRALHDEVARPAAAAVERTAERLAHAAGDAPRRAVLTRLADAARAAQAAGGRPATLRSRLAPLDGELPPETLAGLGALLDDVPAPRGEGAAAREPIATSAQLLRARAWLDRHVR
jgi:hypothetical protein